MGSSGDTITRAREQCLRDYRLCADACEAALDRLHRRGDSTDDVRNELIVCVAVCRVAARALEEATTVATVLVEYSVDVCRRCAEELGLADDVAKACAAAADSAATLLLVG